MKLFARSWRRSSCRSSVSALCRDNRHLKSRLTDSTEVASPMRKTLATGGLRLDGRPRCGGCEPKRSAHAPASLHLPSSRARQAYWKCLSLEVRQNGDQGSIQESRCDMVREDRDDPGAQFSRLAGSVGRIDGKAIANRNLGVLCKAPETLPRGALHAHAVMSQKIGRRRSGQPPSHA
jgi:hypothetical protein